MESCSLGLTGRTHTRPRGQDQLVSSAKLAGFVNVTCLTTPASDDERVHVLEYLQRVRKDLPPSADQVLLDLEFAEVCVE